MIHLDKLNILNTGNSDSNTVSIKYLGVAICIHISLSHYVDETQLDRHQQETCETFYADSVSYAPRPV